jgi:hypothetical protein
MSFQTWYEMLQDIAIAEAAEAGQHDLEEHILRGKAVAEPADECRDSPAFSSSEGDCAS